MAALEKEFDQAMFDIYRRADKEIGYRPTIFLDMLHRQGGVATAKQLISASRPSEGYTRLYEKNRLDLTVEAVVTDNPKWHPLFTEEDLGKALKRLKDYRYKA
jgi:hypothetical protein